jgi:hypothetical protein
LMVNILEHQFASKIEDSERTRVIQSVRLRLSLQNWNRSPNCMVLGEFANC